LAKRLRIGTRLPARPPQVSTSYQEALVKDIVSTAVALFPQVLQCPDLSLRLRDFAIACFKQADEAYGIDEATKWAQGYQVPQSVVDRDEALLAACHLDLTLLVRSRLSELSGNRMSLDSIDRVISLDNPELEHLKKLATIGITVHTAPDFICNTSPMSPGPPPPLRNTFVQAASAVELLEMTLFHQSGLAFVLSKATALLIKGVHLSPYSWTGKSGVQSGRPISDASDGGAGNSPLNSPEAKAAADEEWSEIRHKTLKDFVRRVLEFGERQLRVNPLFDWSDVILWKMDLKGAYTLLSFRPEDVCLMANEMSGGRVMFHLCGQFGWTGTPAAFQVVTRALAFELNRYLLGLSDLYVDDIFGVCLKSDLETDIATCTRICEGLLGVGAIAPSKTTFGRRVTVIGYDLDLDTMSVAIAAKNVRKAGYGFFTTNLNKSCPVRHMMRLASYASRYSEIVEEMKPFVRLLYSAYTGLALNTSFTLQDRTKQTIRVFQVLLALTAVLECQFSRSMVSFRPVRPIVIVEFDASLYGAGILWYTLNDDDTESLIGGSAVDLSPLCFGDDSSYQNTAEFIALTLGIRGVCCLGLAPCSVHVRGDSTTALTWSEKGNVRSDRALNTATLFMMQNISQGVTISGRTHLNKEFNVAADTLSRDLYSLSRLADLLHDQRFSNIKEVPLRASEFLALCDPSLCVDTDSSFIAFSRRARAAIATM